MARLPRLPKIPKGLRRRANHKAKLAKRHKDIEARKRYIESLRKQASR